MSTAEEAEEVREAALLRHLRRLGAQVPFADHAGHVTGFFQMVGQGGFRERQAMAAAGIVLMAEACLLAAGE